MESNTKTDFLIPETDFVISMGSVASIYGKYYDYSYSDSAAEADIKAISNDWRMVGRDILKAILKFKSITKSNE